MSAILCSSCRKLISSDETLCPHCGTSRPGLLQGPLAALFRGNLDLVNVVWWASGAIFLVSIALDVRSALSIEGLSSLSGLLSFGSPSMAALYLMGMTGGLAWDCGHYWTLLTATFLHGGLLHIFFNLYWLRILGPTTTSAVGPARFTVIYLLTGVGGFLLSNLYSGVPTIGASCSVFGLMGVLVVYGKRRGGSYGEDLSRQVLTWAIVCFLISFMIPHVNNAGHVGGFVTGLLMGAALPMSSQGEGRGVQLLAVALVAATVAGFGLSGWKMWQVYQTGLAVCF
ncbi:MAG: rhomboid protease GluP [Myxococcota bacterium]|jgi:rhomboid protease GluP